MKTISYLIISFIMISISTYGNDIGKTREKIFSRFSKMVHSNKNPNTGLLLVKSNMHDIYWKEATNISPEVTADTEQPLHFASIGKTITSTIIMILFEQGMIHPDDTIKNYLDARVMKGLHILKGKDYSNEIIVRNLLNHSSGLPDYYMDKNAEGVRLLDRMLTDPNHFWTPIETIDWTKQHLTPKFKPGKGFHYSDTNYQLLGLIIEKITGLPLHEAYQKFIFIPLAMKHSFMVFHSLPTDSTTLPMTDLFYKGQNLSVAQSISMSWASGGTVSTLDDMFLFIQALQMNKLIRHETFIQMQDWNRMGPGIRYGYGLMNFRFFGMPAKYEIWGNSGSVGAFMYYSPAMDVYIVGSFNKFGWQVQPIFFIIQTLRQLNKYLKTNKK